MSLNVKEFGTGLVPQASYKPQFPAAHFCLFENSNTMVLFVGSIIAKVPIARVRAMVYWRSLTRVRVSLLS
jgi:hypothetical protein